MDETKSQAVSPAASSAFLPRLIFFCPHCGNKTTLHPMDASVFKEGRGMYAGGKITCKNCGRRGPFIFEVQGDSLIVCLSSPDLAQIRGRKELTNELLELWRKSKK